MGLRWRGSGEERTDPCGEVFLERLRGGDVARCELGVEPAGVKQLVYRILRGGSGGEQWGWLAGIRTGQAGCQGLAERAPFPEGLVLRDDPLLSHLFAVYKEP